MDSPLCRLCGTRHWSGEPHKFGDIKELEQKLEDLREKAAKLKSDVSQRAGDNGGKSGQNEVIVSDNKELNLKKGVKVAQKCVHINRKPIDRGPKSGRKRQVNVRMLRKKLSSELQNLPFNITKHGRIIARVIKA